MSTPKALGSAHVLIKSSVFSTLCPRTEFSGHGVGGQRVENTESFPSDSLLVCTLLKRLVSMRAGTCRASTTFYPCRLVAGHLIPHALFGAGDTNDERAPSTESVCFMDPVGQRARSTTRDCSNSFQADLVGYVLCAQATFRRAPCETTPASTTRHRSMSTRRARPTMPMRRWRLLPPPKRSWNQRLCLLFGW